MNKKYELTNEKIKHNGRILYRIRALKDFDWIKRGDLGGYVQSEDNLSHDGLCWLYDDAKAYDNAQVKDICRLHGHAEIFDNAIGSGFSSIADFGKVHGNAILLGKGTSIGYNAVVKGNVKVIGSTISGNAVVDGNVQLKNHVLIKGNANVYGNLNIYDFVTIDGKAIVHGDFDLHNHVCINGNIELTNPKDYLVFCNVWSPYRHITWTKSNNMWSTNQIWSEESFHGTADELIEHCQNNEFHKTSTKICKRYIELVQKLYNA